MEYKPKEQILKEFHEKLFPILVTFEQVRKKRLLRMIIIELILVVICTLYYCNSDAISSFFLKNNSQGLFNTLHYTICACVLSAFIYPFIVISDFKEDLKNEIMPMVIESFESIKHSTGITVISEKELLESTLFSRFNIIEPDDCFRGIFNGVCFNIMETKLILVGRKSRITSFKGVIIRLYSNKKINAKTTITSANDFNVRNNMPLNSIIQLLTPVWILIFLFIIGKMDFEHLMTMLFIMIPIYVFGIFMFAIISFCSNMFKSNKNDKQMKRIKFEDIKFAKYCKVFSQDEVAARYLITPVFLEKFLNLKLSFGANKAKCAFYDNKIMFAVSTTKDLFEFGGLFKSLENPKNIGFFNEVFSILEMIESVSKSY